MNFFYGINNYLFKSEVQIPLFQNRNFKKSNLKLFKSYPKNNKWIFLKDLEIPSKELIASSSNYVKGKDFHDEWTKIFKSKEKFKVYAVVSKKSELLPFAISGL